MEARRNVLAAARRSTAALQRRTYYPTSRRAVFDYEAEKDRWVDGSVRALTVSEMYHTIHQPLSEVEDIMSTWRESKWFNRDLNKATRDRIDTFLSNKYDHGLEPNLLERLLIQYALVRDGSFEGAFHGYFRNKEGVTVYDTEPRWDTLRKHIFTNVPVIDDLFALSGMGEDGYRKALGNLLLSSFEHALPTGKSRAGVHATVMFQHREENSEGGQAVRLLGSHDEADGVDYMLLQPHPSDPLQHQLHLVIIGSDNKYRRSVQVPNEALRAKMAARTAQVFGLPEGSVDTAVLFTPPWLLDRHSLLKCHTMVGGVAPSYADWLPYYNFDLTKQDPDWAYQAKKDAEDEFYQL